VPLCAFDAFDSQDHFDMGDESHRADLRSDLKDLAKLVAERSPGRALDSGICLSDVSSGALL